MEISFANSRILFLFPKTLAASFIEFVPLPLLFPKEVLIALEKNWQEQLGKKQAQLQSRGIFSTIKSYRGNENELALYVNGKTVMWPGGTITLQEAIISEKNAQLKVSAVSYPFISALNDQSFRKKLSQHALPFVRPPLAVCTFAITRDNFLVLTVRGDNTNVYPGRFYGQGGNPERVNFNLIEHQLDEIKDELLVDAGEVSANSFRFYGIVEDKEQFPGKTDLIGVVSIALSKNELEKRFYDRKLEEREVDAVGLHFVSFNKEVLSHFLKTETSASKFCPPAHGGLLFVGLNEFGESWLKEVLE